MDRKHHDSDDDGCDGCSLHRRKNILSAASEPNEYVLLRFLHDFARCARDLVLEIKTPITYVRLYQVFTELGTSN